MGNCSIDHSYEDVVQKLESQKECLPGPISEDVHRFLQREHSQQTLNELFHLLKKYDLASEEEREERNLKLKQLTG